jgi:hypothetical protein
MYLLISKNLFSNFFIALFRPELALAVLDLAYQRSTPDIDPNVHPDTPLAEALQNFQVELKNYSYLWKWRAMRVLN